MTDRKRPIRQRVWDAEKIDGRAVGESLRNLDSALLAIPAMRIVTFDNHVYTAEGITFPQTVRPQGVLLIFAETSSGDVNTAALTQLKYDGTVAAVKFGLTPGERYATIRLLVIG